MPLFGHDMSLEELISRQINFVATSFLTTDVATTYYRRDLNSLYLMSRPLDVVATFWSLQRMSRQLNDVATSFPYSCCRDCLMMSRPQVFTIDVATTRCFRDLLLNVTGVATA